MFTEAQLVTSIRARAKVELVLVLVVGLASDSSESGKGGGGVGKDEFFFGEIWWRLRIWRQKPFLNLINYPNFILNFAISGGLRENVVF